MKEKMKAALFCRIPGLFFGLLMVAGTLIQAETITPGYHFLDDHELLRIEYSLETDKVPLRELVLA